MTSESGPRRRFLGVTVQPMYFQSEGVNAVLDSLADAGVTAIATAPSVYEPVDALPGGEDAGSSEELPRREPPVDAGAGSVRVVERLLWGKEEVLINPSPSAAPNMELYRGLRYHPPPATALTHREGGVVRRVIDGAHSRGMRAYLQVSAVQVPGRREEDLPRLPDGSYPRKRMVHTLSVASDDVRAYVCARAKDLLTSYPDIDGLRHDWPEYPPYCLGDAFLDFSDNARRAAARLGFGFDRMRAAAGALYERLRHLSDADLELLSDRHAMPYALARGLAWNVGAMEFLRFKAALTTMYVKELREAMDSASDGAGKGKELSPNAFPPPLSLLSGVDYAAVSQHADSINMKLYTMHWPVIVRFYAEEILANNDGPLNEELLLRALSNAFDFEDGRPGSRLADYRYPPPDAPHRAGAQAQLRKIKQATADTGGRARLHPIVHGYGPLDDFAGRLRLAWDAGTPGIWVNRYAYLGPAKIDAIKQLGNSG
jgi:hypothetical protein